MLAALLALTLGAPAAQAPSTILVLPFSVAGESSQAQWTGMAIAESVIDFVAQVNQDNFVTLKQLDSVLRPRDLKLTDGAALTKNAMTLARALGATDVIVGEVSHKGDIYMIQARRLTVPTGAVAKQGKVQGGKAVLPILTKKIAGELTGTTTKVPPLSKSQAALDEAAHCTALLARQSLSPRAKGLLDDPSVKTAEERCRAALEIDPQLGVARAGLAIALAIKGNLDEAKTEAQLVRKDRFVPLAVLAEAFALRKSGNAPAARTVLDDAVVARPGFLHALGYLGEEKMDGGDNAAAQAAKVEFERYLKRAPAHPWASAKLGHALSRLGKTAEAIKVTRQALDKDPGDPELSIELASRLIDAKQDAEAEPHLRAAMDAQPPRTLAGLRLGYLYLRAKRLKDAKELFNRVVAAATRTDESRLRAVAQADLARVAAMEGSLDEAIQRLSAARDEGMRKLPCDEPAFAQWKGKQELEEVCKEPEGGKYDPIDENETASVDF